MKIYKITEASDYLGVSINTLKRQWQRLPLLEKPPDLSVGSSHGLTSENYNQLVDSQNQKCSHRKEVMISSFESARDIITVKSDLKRVAKDLEEMAAAYAVMRKRLGKLSAELEIAYARSYAGTDTSMKIDDRKAAATLETEGLKTAVAVAEAETDVLKQYIRVLESVLNSCQTLAGLVKSEEHLARGFAKL
jgi:hypothetical protein